MSKPQAIVVHIDGLVQERRNSITDALELRLSCTNPSISSADISSISYFLGSIRDGNSELPKRPVEPDSVPLERYLVSAPGAAEYMRLPEHKPVQWNTPSIKLNKVD